MSKKGYKTLSNLIKFIAAGLIMIGSGCTAEYGRNQGNLVLESKTTVSVEQDSSRDIARYETFSLDGVEDVELENEIRESLESKGYRYQASGADFSVSVSAKSVYRELTIEPEVYEVYHPPGTYHPYYHGKPYNPHASYYYYGHYSKVVRPGYEHKYHEPTVNVVMMDARGEIWSGAGQAITSTDDMSLAKRYVVREVLEHLPEHR